MRLADLAAEAAEDGEALGMVIVGIPTVEGPRGPRGLEQREVPARYGREPRCADRAACAARAAAAREPMTTAAPAAPDDVEEVPSWL